MQIFAFLSPVRSLTVCMTFLALFICGCQKSDEPPSSQPADNAQAGNATPSATRDWLKTDEFFDHYAELNAPILAIPEAERAWPRYRKVLPGLNDIDHWKYESLTPGSGPWQEAEAFIAEFQKEIDEIVEISKLKTLGYLLAPNLSNEDARAFGFPQVEKTENAPLGNANLLAIPELAPTVLLLNTAAKQAASRNEADVALKYLCAALDICRQMEQVPSFAAQSITTAKYVEVFANLREITQSQPKLWNGEQLKQLQTSLQDAPLFSMTDLIEFDSFRMVIDGVVHIRNDKSGVVGPFEKLGLTLGEWTNRLASTEEELKALEDIKTKAIEEYSRPIHARTGWSAYTTVKDAASSTRPKYFYPMLYPAVESAYYSLEMLHQERDAMLVAVGVLRHYQLNNQWPQQLSDLESAILTKLPLDRFDGNPIRYKNVDGEVTLYSVSVNKTDDSGISGPPILSSNLAKLLAEKADLANTLPGDWILWSVTTKSP